jgi:superfamily II DNA or RNA helicase
MYFLKREPHTTYIDENVWVPKRDGYKALVAALTFETRDGVEPVCVCRTTPHHIVVPRFFDLTNEPLTATIDLRPNTYEDVPYISSIKLDAKVPNKTTQQDAVSAFIQSNGGMLHLACGKGKTVISLEIAARMRVPVLIMAHTKQLIVQWLDTINNFLKLPGDREIASTGNNGRIVHPERPIHILTYQHVYGMHLTRQEIERYGLIIYDEAHHVGARTFSRTADMFPGKRLGLTATPKRSDGMDVLNSMHLGPILYKDLSQPLTPEIHLYQTGITHDETGTTFRAAALDKRGEIHHRRLASYVGNRKERVDHTITLLEQLHGAGKNILVISQSIRTLFNLFAAWNCKKKTGELPAALYLPNAPDTESNAHTLSKREISKKESRLDFLSNAIKSNANPIKTANYVKERDSIRELLAKNKEEEMSLKAQTKAYVTAAKKLMEGELHAGLLTRLTKQKQMRSMLHDYSIVFSIDHYGIESMDKAVLDTVVLCDPIPRKENLQQLVGRLLRVHGDKQPLFIAMFDNLTEHQRLLKKMRSVFLRWPLEEGGPLNPIIVEG